MVFFGWATVPASERGVPYTSGSTEVSIEPHEHRHILKFGNAGGFATGTTASFDGAPIVERSVALGEPIIYVSMNYRLNGEC